MSFEFEEKSELSHTPQVENPVRVIRFPHCNKGNEMKPYRGLNVWLAFSLHPADMGSTCQAAEWGPLPTRFPIPLLMFSSPSSRFLCPAMRFVTSHNPQDAKSWLFVNNTQPWSESSDSQTKALSWLGSTTANSLALNWQGKTQRERERKRWELEQQQQTQCTSKNHHLLQLKTALVLIHLYTKGEEIRTAVASLYPLALPSHFACLQIFFLPTPLLFSHPSLRSLAPSTLRAASHQHLAERSLFVRLQKERRVAERAECRCIRPGRFVFLLPHRFQCKAADWDRGPSNLQSDFLPCAGGNLCLRFSERHTQSGWRAAFSALCAAVLPREMCPWTVNTYSND